MKPLQLLVTLWPSFKHFGRFAKDKRLQGIRLNSAMIDQFILGEELDLLTKLPVNVPLHFDIKGQQIRIEEVHLNESYLDITINHPIAVQTPTPVLFKAGEDSALLVDVIEHGRRLIFRGGPEYMVNPGESLHIRHPSLKVSGPIFTQAELSKIEQVRNFGFTNYFLSYVEEQRAVDQFRELVGYDSHIMLKIESKKGLQYVSTEYQQSDKVTLTAARGDLYVEVEKPHHILSALRLIIEKDPNACAASRLLLSVVDQPVPSCADFSELAWLYDIGFRNMMLCDELCLQEEMLATAINAFDSFRLAYPASETNNSRFGWIKRFKKAFTS